MDIWEALLPLLISIILPVVFSIFSFFKVRGEKNFSSQEVIRTRPPKALSGFFLGFALLVLLGGIAAIIYGCVADSENTTVSIVVVTSVFVSVFFVTGSSSVGFSSARFAVTISRKPCKELI